MFINNNTKIFEELQNLFLVDRYKYTSFRGNAATMNVNIIRSTGNKLFRLYTYSLGGKCLLRYHWLGLTKIISATSGLTCKASNRCLSIVRIIPLRLQMVREEGSKEREKTMLRKLNKSFFSDAIYWWNWK